MENVVLDLAKYAYEHVPFYNRLYDNYGIDFNNDNLKIEDLPIIRKEDFITQTELLISDEYNVTDLVTTHTSGTSGFELNVYNTKSEQMQRAMILWRERERNFPGIMREKKAMFTDASWFNDSVNIIGDMLYLNTKFLDEKRFEDYFSALNKFQPKFIHCPPSALYEFVSYLIKTSKNLNYRIDYIELAGEFVSDGVYKELSHFFDGTTIINYYGAIEVFSIAHGCKNKNLHIIDDSVFVEVDNCDSQGFGQLVITSLVNKAMPFIRYKIGDIGKISENTCSCGKREKIIDLKSGRIYDYYKDGNRKITADFFRKVLAEYFKETNDERNLIQFSIKQEKQDLLHYFLAVQDKNKVNTNELKEYLLKSINDFLSNPVRIEISTNLNMLDHDKTRKFKMYDMFK